jgi:hypothetical protein
MVKTRAGIAMIDSQSTLIPATAGIHNHYQRDLLEP